MKLNLSNIRVISFTGKVNTLNYDYTVGNFHVMRSGWLKGLGVPVDCKLYFHHEVDFHFPPSSSVVG
jgi:hypothetical protein